MIFFYKMYVELLIVTIMLVILIWWSIKRTRIIKWEQAPEYNQKFLKKFEHKINSWIKGIGILWCSIILMLSIPKFMDFKDVVKKEFQFVTGTVLFQDNPEEQRNVKRTIQIEDVENNEKYQLYIFHCPYLEEGEIITVAYLGNSHYGVIVERQAD